MSHLLKLFTENIVPIIIVASVGFALQRRFQFNPRPISIIVFYALTPCLIFMLLINSPISGTDILTMSLFASAVILVVLLISYIVGILLRLSRQSKASFVLSSTFMNAGNYGLALNQFAFGSAGLAWASIYYITNALWTTSAGVVVASAGKLPIRQALMSLFRVPALYAIGLAAIVRAVDWELPIMLERPLTLLSDATVPMMLLALGMQIGKAGLPRRRDLLSISIAIRLLISPLVALALALLIGLSGLSFKVGIIESAMPTAVLSSIIAMEYDTEPRFVTGAVLVSTLISPITLTVLLALLNTI